jgi:methylenetetrahydrofolate dehydrogenase (NADP+)/methenyltetrahydrofolate cyclohydrolase
LGAHVIDGRGLAAELKEELAAEVAGLRDAGVVTGLATVLVGSPAEALSPVPGGVDPITDVWLLNDTADAARISTRVEAARRSLETADTGV